MPSRVYVRSGPTPREAAGRAIRDALGELGEIKGRTTNIVVVPAGKGRFLRGPGVYTLEEVIVALKNAGARRIKVLLLSETVADIAILGYLRYNTLNLASVSLFGKAPRGLTIFAFLPHYDGALKLGKDLVPDGLKPRLVFADAWSIPIYSAGKLQEEVRVGLEMASPDLEALDSVLEYILLSGAKAPQAQVVGEDPSLWRSPIE